MSIDELRWQAVLARDTSQDGAFVYAVRSTGIFCRPSCPSRRPGREQVAFFTVAGEARQAGFRPCRRCCPEADAAPEVELTAKICRALEQAEEIPTLAELGDRFGLSPAHLQRVFTRAVGVSPREYARALRAGRLREGLRTDTDAGITGALFDAGYMSSGRAYAEAPARLGMTPGTYRRGGEGATVRFTTVQSSLGQLLVAATERGISFVAIGEKHETLEQELRSELPAATIERDDAALAGQVEPILQLLEGRAPRVDLPVDVRATAFQEQVWRALREIPAGETRTYSQLATSIGKPGAARAGGQACGSNPVALVVPCHRVVREDGSLGGYRWGTERKRRILEREKDQRS
jgi:AraC family transcriptional regulator of adaptative response/methylated-DNA-[protein]-cysteine methyltransferase